MGRDCKRHCDHHDCDHRHDRMKHFPDSIRDLLCLLVDEDDNRVTIVTNTCEDCVQENVEVVAVIGSLAVFRCHDKFKFVNICCICEVIVDCDVILTELLESKSDC